MKRQQLAVIRAVQGLEARETLGVQGAAGGRAEARAASDAVSVPAVRSRVEQLRTNGERLVKEMENLYDVELLRLPAALREMNWLLFTT